MTTNSKIRHALDRPDDVREANASNLDQVRDILFGREIRDVEGRLEGIQAYMTAQIEDSRAVFTSRIHAFEEFMKKRLDDLSGQIAAEREQRKSDVESFHATFREAIGDLRTQLTTLEDSATSKDAAMRQHVASEIQGVTNRLEQMSNEMRIAVLDEAEAIRSEKMDKDKIVALFSDLALRLREDRPNTPAP